MTTALATDHRSHVIVIDDQPGDAAHLCQLLAAHGVTARTISLRAFLVPPTALTLLLGSDVAAMLLTVPADDANGRWSRVSVVRRFARLCEVPLVITRTSGNGVCSAHSSAAAIELSGAGAIETLATAVVRFVHQRGAPTGVAWTAA